MSKGRLIGAGTAVLGAQARTSKRAAVVYLPLKDVEIIALQQLS